MRIRRETVAEQSVQLLRAEILERRLLPGATVTEEAMARDIVSISPVASPHATRAHLRYRMRPARRRH